MQRSYKDYFLIALKGMSMGAADVVPGVSGGTIAFISGIYMELINTIDKLDIKIFGIARRDGLKTVWKEYNLGFLFSLVLGIGISIFTFARIISYLLKNEPIIIWSFFFGLVLASILFIAKQIKNWHLPTVLALLFGIGISFYITIAEPTSSPDSYWFLLLSGFIAIIAMILPGVSGAFILLLLGSYNTIISSINQFSTSIFKMHGEGFLQSSSKLLVFAVGALLGIKVFSKILTWMFEKYKGMTLALLTGFMVGSLNKIWPWKKVVTSYTNRHHEVVPILEKSIWPNQFSEHPQIPNAFIFCIIGFLTIYLLEKFAVSKSKPI